VHEHRWGDPGAGVMSGDAEHGHQHRETDAELMQLVSPMCVSASLTEEQSRRLLAMILDGLRHPS
jgi:hypothetical protein